MEQHPEPENELCVRCGKPILDLEDATNVRAVAYYAGLQFTRPVFEFPLAHRDC